MAKTPLSPYDQALDEIASEGLSVFKPQVQQTERRPSQSSGSVPQNLLSVFDSASTKYQVPVNILLGLAEQESNFNPTAVGQQTQWGRAKGLMQYLDTTASNLGINPYDPVQSVDAAARQIRERLDKGYSMEDAVKEHFAGPNRKMWGAKTAQYGVDVMRRAQKFLNGIAGGPDANTQQPQEQANGQDPFPRAKSAMEDMDIQRQKAEADQDQLLQADLAELNKDEPGRFSIPTDEQIRAYYEKLALEDKNAKPIDVQEEARKAEELRQSMQQPTGNGEKPKNQQAELKQWNPTLWERIQMLIPGDRDAAAVEVAARKIAKRDGISVDEVYRSIGGNRPMFNPEGRAPIQALSEGAGVVAKQLPDVPAATANAALRAVRGGDVPVEDKSMIDRGITATDIPPDPNADPNYDSLQGIGQSLGFTASNLVPSIALGAAGNVVSPVAGTAAGFGTSATIAYRASKDQFLSDVRKMATDKKGSPLTEKEWDDIKIASEAAATSYGAWEAIPEALGSVVALRMISHPLAGGTRAARLADATRRLAKEQAMEQATETATTWGQNKEEQAVGLTNEDLSLGDAFRKQALQTAIVTGISGGTAQIGRAVYDRIRGNTNAAPENAAETSPEGDNSATDPSSAQPAAEPAAAAPAEAQPQPAPQSSGPLGRALERAVAQAEEKGEPIKATGHWFGEPGSKKSISISGVDDFVGKIEGYAPNGDVIVRDEANGEILQFTPEELQPTSQENTQGTSTEEGGVRPGETAIWRNADNDIPVTIINEESEPGSDGRKYTRVGINGQESYVPSDELIPNIESQPESAQSVPDNIDPDTGEVLDTVPVVEEAAPPRQKSYDEMDEPELRQRLKYLVTQAKQSGWDTRLTAERRKVEAAIDAKTANVPNEQPANVEVSASAQPDNATPVQSDESGVPEQPAGNVSTGESGTGVGSDVLPVPATADANAALNKDGSVKWFGRRQKAEEFIAKKGLADTHEIRQVDRRFEIHPKAEATSETATETAASAEPAEQKPVSGRVPGGPRVNRARKLVGGTGDTVSPSSDVGSAKAGQAYEVIGILRNGLINLRNLETGETANVSNVEMEAAHSRNVKWNKRSGDSSVESVAETETESTSEQQPESVNFSDDIGKFSRGKWDFVSRQTAEDGTTTVTLRSSNGRATYDVAESRLRRWVDKGVLDRVPSENAAGVADEPVKAPDWQNEEPVVTRDYAEVQNENASRDTQPETFSEHLDALEKAYGKEGSYSQQRKTSDSYRAVAAALDTSDQYAFHKGMESDYYANRKAALDLARSKLTPQPDASSTNVSEYGANNKLVSQDRAAELRKKLKAKFSQLNSGIDPEILAIGTELAVFHIEASARKFSAFAKAMAADLDMPLSRLRPYLRSWYNGARDMMEDSGISVEGMDSPESVRAELAKLDQEPQTEAPRQQERSTGALDDMVSQFDEEVSQNVSSTSGSVEQNSGNAGDTVSVVQAADVDAGRSDASGAGRASEGAQPERSAGQRDQRLSNDGSTAGGARSDQRVHQPSGEFGLDGSTSRSAERSGSRSDSVAGSAVERGRAESIVGNAPKTGNRELDQRIAAQRKADKTPTKWGDKASIDAALPLLLPAQRDDVLKVEQQHAKMPGILITNGTGTGKTASGMGVAKRYANAGKDNILIVVPTDKIAADWVKFGGMMGLKVKQLEGVDDNGGKGPVITTYANMGQNDALTQRDWDLIIPDEAHYLSSNEKGDDTAALSKLRALTGHPKGFSTFMASRYADKYKELEQASHALDELRATQDATRRATEFPAAKTRYDRIDAEWKHLTDENRKAWQERWSKQQDIPKVVFLSATPFAYVKNVDYAEGYLFNYTPPADQYNERSGGGYNSGNDYQSFFMQHFGYRMRYNKLTQPEAGVNSELMEQNFNQWLKDTGALTGRTLDVPHDYDRKFALIDDAAGRKLDEALRYLNEAENGRYRPIYEEVMRTFDYMRRMFLLESMKARAAVPMIKQHLAMGRKVVVFHDYNKGGGFSPFAEALPSIKPEMREEARQLFQHPRFRIDFRGLEPAIDTMKKAFPDALLFNGTVSKAQRRKNADLFNDDKSRKNLIVVQSDAGREGVSLHDTTGKHQRVLINLGMPVKPVAATQIEGRIYRTGQASDAVFRYLTTGTAWEASAFASKIAERASTAENLALGTEARGLKQSFIDAYNDADVIEASQEDGKGGKEYDRSLSAGRNVSPFQKAKTFYYAQQKNTKRRDQREGVDYFATPEPVGMKMVEWADIKPGDKVLEPSAGHGAIARFFPDQTDVTMVEPSYDLSQRAALANGTAKIVNSNFEDFHITNKFDAIVMNPPYGSGGKTAIEHVAKAGRHLREGGRIVALIPRGGMADRRLNEFLKGDDAKGLHLVAKINMPSSTFERAGTSVNTQVLVLEKHSQDEDAQGIQQRNIDLSNAENVNELFDRIENLALPQRQELTADEAIANAVNNARYSIAPATDTAAFKRWFGSSKVVNENGDPLVVYHGTPADISAFDPGRAGEFGANFGQAVFFSSDPSVASGYSVRAGTNEDVASAVSEWESLAEKRAQIVKSGGIGSEQFNDIRRQMDELAARQKAARRKVVGYEEPSQGANVVPAYLSIKNPHIVDAKGKFWSEVNGDAISDALSNGNDGVIIRNVIDPANEDTHHPADLYVVFSPEQIKSAVGNQGTFDPNNPDIRYSVSDVRSSITSGELGGAVENLLDAGQVVIHQQAPEGVPNGTQAWTDEQGIIHLVAERLNPSNAMSVLLHEAFHAGAKPLVGEARWKNLNERFERFLRAAESRSDLPPTNDWERAYARIMIAESMGDQMNRERAREELAAYAVENFERMPPGIRKWVQAIIGAVKEFIASRFGKQLGEVTPGQLRAMAKAALRSGSVSTRQQTTYSNAGMTATELATQLREEFEGLKLGLTGSGKIITLARIVVPESARNEGTGSQIMQRIVDWADQNGKTIALSPTGDFGGSKTRLVSFYKRFGFIENKGSNKDYEISETMYREPGKPANRYSVSDGGTPSDSEVNSWISQKWDATKELSDQALKTAMPTLLHWTPSRVILTRVGKDIPALKEYADTKLKMDTFRDDWHAKTDKLAQRWTKYRSRNKAENTELMGLMHETTVAQVDPSEEFKPTLNNIDLAALRTGDTKSEAFQNAQAKADADKVRRRDYDILKERFDKLSPEAQQLYRDVRDIYTALANTQEQIIIDNLQKAMEYRVKQAERDFDDEMQRIRDEGLKGQEATDAVEAAKKRLENARKRDAWNRKARITQLRAEFESNRLAGPYFPLSRFGDFFVTARDKATGEVVSFSRMESAREQDRVRKELEKKGYKVEVGVMDNATAVRKQVPPDFVARIEDILKDLPAAKETQDQVWQLYLQTMPDYSLRKNRIHRKGRAGFEEDALRAFASHMFHGAHQTARLKYAMDLADLIDVARRQAKNTRSPVRSGLVVNQIEKNHQYVMNPTSNRISQIATQGAFMWFLAQSPAAALVNMAQTFIIGVPKLASFHGGNTAKGMAVGLAETSKALADITRGGFFAEKSAGLNEDEKKALDTAYRMGLITRTQSHDVAGIADSGIKYTATRARLMAALSWMFHHGERVNREATFLAAYRMAKRKGFGRELAIDKAATVTWDTHYDYQNTSRPAVMHSNTGKALLVFRNYTLNMLSDLAYNTYTMINPRNAAERKEARTQLLGIGTMLAFNAGIRGLPLYGIAMMIAGMFSDDGEDPETELRKTLLAYMPPSLVGMMMDGVPGYTMGIELSQRIGFGDLWFRSDDRDREGQEAYNYWLQQVLGASVAIPANWTRGIDQISDGYTWRGIETIVPKMLRDPMKAWRYYSEGATTKLGDPIVDDVNGWDIFKQAIGFTPAAIAEQYKLNNVNMNKQKAILDKRTKLLSDYYKADVAGDEKKMDEIGKKMDEFSDKYPEMQIDNKTIRRSIKNRERYRDSNTGGMSYNNNLRERLIEEQPAKIYR